MSWPANAGHDTFAKSPTSAPSAVTAAVAITDTPEACDAGPGFAGAALG